ncbi:MAG TPA: YdcF family protein [Candidatus Limnocylindria bacterium]|nr:YdcF family protein [Candidatus Limnocylindria bacterium]
MRTFLFGVLVGAVLMLSIGVGTLVVLGHALAVRDPLAKVDVIVAVSGDTGPRTETAVRLWQQGYAPLLLFSGASLDPNSVSSAELMKRDAMKLGVPERAILIEPDATTTEENARLVAQVMSARGLRTAILVTSPYHQRRAALLFSRAFAPAGLSFRNRPADDPDWDPDRWWTREPSRSLTLVEIAKLGAAILFGNE